MNLVKTIGRNTLFGLGANAAQVGTRILTVPIVIAHLGLDGYGIWSIIMATAAYMRFGSAGIKHAFVKYVAESTGNENLQRASQLLSTGTVVMFGLSIVGLIPVAMFSTRLARIAGVPQEFLMATAASIAVLALIMVISNVAAAYEAVVMGGQRIDLLKACTMMLTILECVAIVLALRMGQGLFAMTLIMAASEVARGIYCYFCASRVLPQLRIHRDSISWTVLPELARFAGSYQLVNLLEVIYGAIIPVAVLRSFGAHAAGVYAICERLVGSALLIQDALLLPILSGGTMVYALSSEETMRHFLRNTFKVALALTLLPLAFLAAFGPTVVLAWTGEVDSSFGPALRLLCAAAFCRGLSLLSLVLYRATGGASMDVLRQAVRIVTMLAVAAVASRTGYYSLLGGLLVAEFIGLVCMGCAIKKRMPYFAFRLVAPDTIRLALAAAGILLASTVVVGLASPPMGSEQAQAWFRLAVVALTSIVSTWPFLFLTRFLSAADSRAILGVFSRTPRKAILEA